MNRTKSFVLGLGVIVFVCFIIAFPWILLIPLIAFGFACVGYLLERAGI